MLCELHQVGLLHVLGRQDGLAVDVDRLVQYLDVFAGQADAAFDEVLALVEGPHPYLVLFPLSADIQAFGIPQGFAPHLAQQVVVAGIAAPGRAHGVALGVVEYNGVETLHLAQSRVAVVGEGDEPRERLNLSVCCGHGVVHEGHGEGRHGGAGTVGNLRHPQVVAHQQRLLHRAGG